MKFEFKINKWANFYFFVQNLSEWHFSCRHSYNEFWRKKLRKFSKKEKQNLKIFTELHNKYPFGTDFFGQVFFIKKEPFVALKKELPVKNFRLLKEVFNIFNSHFEKIYKEDLPLLKIWKAKLEKNANRPLLIKRLNKNLASLYCAKLIKEKKVIKVYLLLSGPNLSSGGANMDNESITLELSRYPLEAVNQIIGVIWHELIHLHFENKNFMPLINKIYNNDQEKVNLIKEAVASSLLPNGVLGINLLGIKSKLLNLNSKISQEYKKPLLELSEIYFKKNKFFDDKYIRKISSILN